MRWSRVSYAVLVHLRLGLIVGALHRPSKIGRSVRLSELDTMVGASSVVDLTYVEKIRVYQPNRQGVAVRLVHITLSFMGLGELITSKLIDYLEIDAAVFLGASMSWPTWIPRPCLMNWWCSITT